MLALATLAVCAFFWVRFVIWAVQDVRFGIVTRKNALQWSALFLAVAVVAVGVAACADWLFGLAI